MSLLCLSRTTVVAVNSPHLWCSPLIIVAAFTTTIYTDYGKHVHMLNHKKTENIQASILKSLNTYMLTGASKKPKNGAEPDDLCNNNCTVVFQG